jgi:hypothetical protein
MKKSETIKAIDAVGVRLIRTCNQLHPNFLQFGYGRSLCLKLATCWSSFLQAKWR